MNRYKPFGSRSGRADEVLTRQPCTKLLGMVIAAFAMMPCLARATPQQIFDKETVLYPVESGFRLLVEDLDGKDGPDVVIGHRRRKSQTTVFWNNGGGLFTDIETLKSGRWPEHIAAVDTDGSGHWDLVVSHSTADDGGEVRILRRKRGRRFKKPRQVTVLMASEVRDLVVEDLDGDRAQDILILDDDSDLRICWGGGDGEWTEIGWLETEFTVESVLTADLNQDGRPEVLADGSVFWNQGERSFEREEHWESGSIAAVDDLDGDGLPDVMVRDGWNLDLYRNTGEADVERIQSISNPGYIMLVVSVDLNADGRADWAVATGSLCALLPDGAETRGEFDFSLYLSRESKLGWKRHPIELPVFPTDVAFADLDQDGMQDLIAVSSQPGFLVVKMGRRPGQED